MQSRLGSSPKFNRYFIEADFKIPLKLQQKIKQQLNSQIVQVNLVNPFLTKNIPQLKRPQLSAIILFMGRQMEQLTIRNFVFGYLSQFISNHRKDLVDLLSLTELHSDVFCLSVARYLQEVIKSGELQTIAPNIKKSSIVEILLQAFQKIKQIWSGKSREQRKKAEKNFYQPLFQALLGYSSVKFISEFSQQDMNHPKQIETAISVSSILMDFVEHFKMFDSVRDFVQFSSHMLIFYQQQLQPIKFYQFCCGQHQGLYKGEVKSGEAINDEMVKSFFFNVRLYIKTDPDYLPAMLTMIKNLLSLYIKSDMLMIHFQALILIMGQGLFTDLKKRLYGILLQSRDKNLQDFIDKIYNELLSADPDVTKSETQGLALKVALLGDNKRRRKFSQIYFYNYTKNSKRLQYDTVNLIVRSELQQMMNLIDFREFIKKEACHLKRSTVERMHEVINIQQEQINRYDKGIKQIKKEMKDQEDKEQKENQLIDKGLKEIQLKDKKQRKKRLGELQQLKAKAAKKKQHYLGLLKIVQERRIAEALKQQSDEGVSHNTIHKSYLQASKGCAQIFEMYAKIVVSGIGKNSFQINNILVNFSSSVIKIDFVNYSSFLQYYSMLLQIVSNNQLFTPTLFKYLITCQAIFGYKIGIWSYKYFSIFLPLATDEDMTEIIFLLEYLVRNLKNKSAVLIYLQAILEFEKSQVNFYKKNLDDINFIIQLLKDSKYFQICTYSFQALTLLQELSILITNEKFQTNSRQLMCRWSRQMSISECNNSCYLFCFREICKAFPYIKEKKDKSSKDRIWSLANDILKLLDVECKDEQFIETLNNQLTVDWKNEEVAKEGKIGMKLEMNILRNEKMQLIFSFLVLAGANKYAIEVKNDRCFIKAYQKFKSEPQIITQATVKELKKNPENVFVSIKIQGAGKNKFTIVLNILGQLIEVTEEGSVSSLTFECPTKSYLSNITVTNLLTDSTLKKIEYHLTEMKNMVVKVKCLPRIKLTRFLNKFDFERMFCIWGEIIKNIKSCNPIEWFKILLRLSFRLFKQLQQQKSHRNPPRQINVFRAILKYLQINVRSLKRFPEFDIEIELKNPIKHASSMYYLYISAFLPRDFWCLFTQQTKKFLLKLLIQCLNSQEFRTIENQHFDLFQQLCELYDMQEGVIDIINQIILTHHENTFLTHKFEHYVWKALKEEAMRDRLSAFLEDMIIFISSEHEQRIRKKILCKFLIIETPIFDIVFSLCSIRSKITLIHYILYNTVHNYTNQEQTIRIGRLVSIMKEEELPDFVRLLIVELKIQSNPKLKNKKLSSVTRKSNAQENYETALHTEFYIIIKLWDKLDIQTLSDAIGILTVFLQNLSEPQVDRGDPMYIEIENTICCEEYSYFLYSLKETQNSQRRQWQKQFDSMFDNSFKIITKSSKKKFLKFMCRYLYIAEKSLKIALYPLDTSQCNDGFQIKQAYIHSILLQYVYELLVLMKYRQILNQQERKKLTDAIFNYVLFFVINVNSIDQISKPLVYSYPKLYSWTNASSKTISKGIITRMEGLQCCELNGGIYFKLLIITIQLLYACDLNSNLTKLIDSILFRSSRRRTIAIVQSNEAIQGDRNDKTRTEMQMASVDEQHKKYYKCKEQPFTSKELLQSRYEISSSLAQFFLMRLSVFLERYADVMNEEILQEYSDIILQQMKNPKIFGQILSTNAHSIYDIVEYEDILQARGMEMQVSSVNVPNPTSSNMFFRVASPAHFAPQGVQRSPVRPRRASHDPSLESKKKNDIMQIVGNNPREWSKCCKAINFDKQFNNKAKEIRFRQLLHIHYVLTRPMRNNGSTVSFQNLSSESFEKRHDQIVRSFNSMFDSSILEESLRKIKKIYPYTSSARTVIRVMEYCLPNMCCPITQHVTCKDYSLKKLRHTQSFNLIRFEEEENLLGDISIEEQGLVRRESQNINQSEIEEYENNFFVEPSEKVKQEKHCQLVTREGVYFCEWRLFERELRLYPKDSRPSEQDKVNIYMYGTPEQNLIKKNSTVQAIFLDDIDEIFYRKFNQIYNSIEIFLFNGTSKFITFYTTQLLKYFMSVLKKKFYGLKIIKNPPQQFSQLPYTDQWVEGYLSNFDYLMLLNKYSGRTLNDVNQYYVFPWILQDYQSQSIDLTDPTVYRDLSKPMGALNPEKLKRFKEIFRGNQGQHMYGSHYSTSLFILFYLVRLEPFTTLHREMQKGFDLADRLFSSIYQVWDTLMCESSTSDIKEVIPQFYYLPAFLKNVGNIEFGEKLNGQEVNDVVLPPWAGSAEEFIIVLRSALESDWVSENLHLWIDLIFGKHQCSEQKNNVFLPVTYEQKLKEKWGDLKSDPRNLKALITQVTYFGQCPSQLFTKEHRPKKHVEQVRSLIRRKTQVQNEQIQIPYGWRLTKFSSDAYKFYLELTNLKDEIYECVIDPCIFLADLRKMLENPKGQSKKKTESRFRLKQQSITFAKSEFSIHQEVIMTLEMNFTYEKVEKNQLWIVCYGSQGLRTYNWQQQLYWKWEQEQVNFVYLSVTNLIFSTPSGKLCYYCFFDSSLRENQAIKQVSSMEIQVVALPRLPSRGKRNLHEYKILCIGDGRKVTMINCQFIKGVNTTSFSNIPNRQSA